MQKTTVTDNSGSIRRLSKESQEQLMWDYHLDAGLQLVYRSFPTFVEARTGIKIGGK